MTGEISGLPIQPQKFFRDQVQNGASNLEVLHQVVQGELLSEEQFRGLPDAYLTGMQSAFKRRFPKDAFDNLRALNEVAAYIEPHPDMDLPGTWRDITGTVGLSPDDPVSVETAWKTFRGSAAEQRFAPVAAELTDRLAAFIAESVARTHTYNDARYLHDAIPAVKLFGYLQKMRAGIQYDCESEFNIMLHFGVDEERLGFRYLHMTEVQAGGERNYAVASLTVPNAPPGWDDVDARHILSIFGRKS